MHESEKMRPVETIPGIRREGIKNGGGAEFNHDTLQELL
jgi:hypothetical protein